MDNQDWNTVVLKRKLSQREHAIKYGAAIKERGGSLSNEAQRAAKLDREEFVKPKHLTNESRQMLIVSRLALKLTQSQLDQQLAIPQNTIREIEAGRLTPTAAQINKLNRHLKIALKLE